MGKPKHEKRKEAGFGRNIISLFTKKKQKSFKKLWRQDFAGINADGESRFRRGGEVLE